MENMNLSDKSKEALKPEKWQELRANEKEEIIREYLKNRYVDGGKQNDISVSGVAYKVLRRREVTTFYDSLGNTLFDVGNEELKVRYEAAGNGRLILRIKRRKTMMRMRKKILLWNKKRTIRKLEKLREKSRKRMKKEGPWIMRMVAK